MPVIHPNPRQKPTILHTEVIAKSRIFYIEQLDLRFSNGEERRFERLKTNNKAVLMVPFLDRDTLLLIREYAAGMDRYELAFPKGLVEKTETVLEAANREMMEEVGYGARQLHELCMLSTSPGYLSSQMVVVVAYDLYEKRLKGDEPEEIEVVPWKFSDLDALLEQPDFTEARSIAALFLTKRALEQGKFL